jgi:hypothetical protein
VNVSNELTIGEFLIGILPRLRSDTSFPSWPPDCFGLCLALLKRTGAYAKLLQDWPPAKDRTLSAWTARSRRLGEKWRRSWQPGGSFDGLSDEWQIVCQSFAVPLRETGAQRALCEALMMLAAVADEACEGVGAPEDQLSDEDDPLLSHGSYFLTESGALCVEIDQSRLQVLPRMHTPQNGLTERSLSLYLSLCEAGEVTPQWLSDPFLQSGSVNLLLIPWPFEVIVSQFHETADAASRLPKDFGFFTFADALPGDLIERVQSLHSEAKRKLGRIDGVVLPELSITDDQFRALRASCPRNVSLSPAWAAAGTMAGAERTRRGSRFHLFQTSSRGNTTPGSWTRAK